ncbi:hypothetical protein KDW_10950 [Dictyobacter vulcani]|uniref:CHAD domain-containing protein n=1 Tax=Dictyobacter vulcani TaxID=2607529 RepID=A0A5J4KGT3_9CHLR|nr:CHAD domain-containing protein [Dictyobacter vulcani]GER86933.1 hypothetical protein KDW_10950 [Dictyobacter vulcani]
MLLLAQRAFGLDAERTTLTHDDLLRCQGILWALPAEEIAERYQLDTKRARIITAGALILSALLETFKLKELHISSFGIREGLALAYARNGEQWLQHAEQQARQGEEASQQLIKDNIASSDTMIAQESFGEAGRRMFQERADTMFSWREAVLRHDDIEAVHKMRVASRRLRAVMDAYQSVCEPKRFKTAYQQVKNIADILGLARDTDVMIENIRQQGEQSSSAEQAACNWLVEQLDNYRQQHQRQLEKYLRQLDDKAFLQDLHACLPEGKA